MLSFKQYLKRLDEAQGHDWEIKTPQQFANFLIELERDPHNKDIPDMRMGADGVVHLVSSMQYLTITDFFISDNGFLKFPLTSILDCSLSINFTKELKSTLGFPKKVRSFVQSNTCEPLPTDFENWPKVIETELILKHFNGDSLVGFSKAFTYIGNVCWLPLRDVRRGGIELIKVEGLKSGRLADYQVMLTGNKNHNYPAFVATQIIDTYLGRPNDIFDCQTALIEAGLEEYTEI